MSKSKPLSIPPILGFNVPYQTDEDGNVQVLCICDRIVMSELQQRQKETPFPQFSREGAKKYLGILLRYYLSTGRNPAEDVRDFQVISCCIKLTEDTNNAMWCDCLHNKCQLAVTIPDTSNHAPDHLASCRKFVDNILDGSSETPLQERLTKLEAWAEKQHALLPTKAPAYSHNRFLSNTLILVAKGEILMFTARVLGKIHLLALVATTAFVAWILFVANIAIAINVNQLVGNHTHQSLHEAGAGSGSVIEAAGLTVGAALTAGVLSVAGSGGRLDYYELETYGQVSQILTGIDYRSIGVAAGTLGSFTLLLHLYDGGSKQFDDAYNDAMQSVSGACFIAVGCVCASLVIAIYWADELEKQKFGQRERDMLFIAAESTYGMGLSSCAILAASGELDSSLFLMTNITSLPMPQFNLPRAELMKAFYGSLVLSQYYAGKDWNPLDTPWSVGKVIPGDQKGGCRIPMGEFPTKVSTTTRNKFLVSVFLCRTSKKTRVCQGLSVSRNICADPDGPCSHPVEFTAGKDAIRDKGGVERVWDTCAMNVDDNSVYWR